MINLDRNAVLVTGAGGIIGSYIQFGLRLGHRDLDITDGAAVQTAISASRPSTVIHLAAATDMERCEREPQYCWQVNVEGTANVARACREIGATLVYVSTAVVFSGSQESFTETNAPNPASVYGRSKLAGEFACRDIAPRSLVLRTSWVFGGGPKRDHKFVGKIARSLSAGNNIRAATDHVGSPTYAKDFVHRMTELISEGRTGIFHVTNSGAPSRYDMAKEIAAVLQPDARIETASYRDFGISADRASREVLTTSLPQLRSWQEALREYLETEWMAST